MSLPGDILPADSTGWPGALRRASGTVLFRALAKALVALLLLAGPLLAVGSIDVTQATLDATDEAYVVNADFNVQLTPRVEEALQNGVALYFVAEFELVRPRWYWFDERTVASRLQYRLTYQPLSRQYRLWTGALHQPFATLAEALRVLGHVHAWAVLERDQVSPDRTYEAAVRLRLDTTQLPKPFQISAITTREWNLASDWKRFSFTPSPAPVVTRSIDAGDPRAGEAKAGENKAGENKGAEVRGEPRAGERGLDIGR